ncbi:unnamed protein product [Effrenium voratum]|uniref:Uncharacterized protein n=1 Tax=Effrenium voratum TaxID=2562239 RepID=A0AA36ML61_9DINO|nr:unnamed protein product [Effrenium voratum]
MLSEMFAHAQKGLQVKTPSNTPNARRRENHRDRGSPAHDEFQIMEPVTLQEPTLSRVPSVPSHVGGSPSAEKKALLAYNQLLEARLRAVTEENRGLRLQHQQDELHLRQSRELDRSMEAQSKARSKAALVFNAWFRVAAQAWRERWRAAEAAVVWQVESERTQHGHLLRAEEAERQSARLEAALERQQRRFAQEEHEAQEAQQQSWALQTSSMQVGKKVQALTEQLSRTEALLVEERHRLRHEERQAREMKLAMSDLQVAHDESREGLAQRLAKTEATLAEERMRADTSRMESKEAGRQLMALQSKVSDSSILENDSKELRQQLLAQQAAKVEAERQVGLLEVEVNKLSCKLRLSESELADAKSQEARHVRIATQEADARAEELEKRLRHMEEQRREADDAVLLAEAERQSATLRLHQAAAEVDMAKATAEAASLEARQLQDMVMKAKANGLSSSQDWSHYSLQSTCLTSDEEARSEMEEALAELRRWRLQGTPPKSGSVLQKGLKARICELERKVQAARAIRERGHQAGNSLAGIASAAVAAARDASSEARLLALEEELADAKEVQAAAEALMKELWTRPSSPGRTMDTLATNSPGSFKDDCQAAAFTSELLEALAQCRLELERARPE